MEDCVIVELCVRHRFSPPLVIPSYPYRSMWGRLLIFYGATTFQDLLGGVFSDQSGFCFARHPLFLPRCHSCGAILFQMTNFFACKTLPHCADQFYSLFNPHSIFARDEDLGRKLVDVLHQKPYQGATLACLLALNPLPASYRKNFQQLEVTCCILRISQNQHCYLFHGIILLRSLLYVKTICQFTHEHSCVFDLAGGDCYEVHCGILVLFDRTLSRTVELPLFNQLVDGIFLATYLEVILCLGMIPPCGI